MPQEAPMLLPSCRPPKCLSCGQVIELGESGLPDHHCSRRHEAAVESANRRAVDSPVPRDLPYGERLELGFSMIGR